MRFVSLTSRTSYNGDRFERVWRIAHAAALCPRADSAHRSGSLIGLLKPRPARGAAAQAARSSGACRTPRIEGGQHPKTSAHTRFLD